MNSLNATSKRQTSSSKPFYLTLLLLFLPLANLTTALEPPIPPKPTGDTFNRTVCYCASPNCAFDQTYGSYFLFEYYNFHLDRTYTIDLICQSKRLLHVANPYSNDGPGLDQNECLRSRFHSPAKHCTSDEYGNKFCYELQGGIGYDRYSWNKKLRIGLPAVPSHNWRPSWVEETCDKKCRDLVGGMHMLKGDALEAIWRDYNTTGERLWSSVVYFPEIPDMWFVNFLKQRLFFNAAVQAARDTCFWQKILTRKLRQQYVQIRELVETFKNDV